MYAFSHKDYIDRNYQYAARIPLRYALRDAFGIKDVIEDTKATLHGEGMDYREFEPAEGKMHQGSGRDRRIAAGLRYARGGQQKYWLPMPDTETTVEAGAKRGGGSLGAVDRARNRATGDEDEAYAPLFEDQARAAIRDEVDSDSDDPADGYNLVFSDPTESDDELYQFSRGYLFGDYNYPCIDVSGEAARHAMWEEEERVLRDQRAAYFSPTLNPNIKLPGKSNGFASSQRGYGATDSGVNGGLGKGKRADRNFMDLDSQFDTRGNLIDFDTERMPDLEVGGVRMKWSRKGNLVPENQRIPGSSNSGSAKGSPRQTGSPISRPSVVARHSSNSGSRSATTSPRVAKRMLPHDAVDLVVEDSKAEEDHLIRERMKGEPAIHAQAGESRALRKVYRRGYKAEDEEGEEADVEVNEERGLVGASDSEEEEPKKVNVKIAKGSGDEGEDTRQFGEPESVEVTDVTVARVATPPPHVRADYSRYTYDDENPWA